MIEKQLIQTVQRITNRKRKLLLIKLKLDHYHHNKVQQQQQQHQHHINKDDLDLKEHLIAIDKLLNNSNHILKEEEEEISEEEEEEEEESLLGKFTTEMKERIISLKQIENDRDPYDIDQLAIKRRYNKANFISIISALFQTTLFYRFYKKLIKKKSINNNSNHHYKKNFKFFMEEKKKKKKKKIENLMNIYISLQDETYMLEDVHDSLLNRYNRLTYLIYHQKRRKTMVGKISTIFGQSFSCFWIYKLITSSINIIFNRIQLTDPVTRLIQLVLKYTLNVHINLRFWSQTITFIFIGIIVSTQSRGFLGRLFHIFNFMIGDSNPMTSLAILFYGELMGMYFISSTLLMRMNLPETYRYIITKALGDIEFSFYHHWFDLLFITSATISLIILALTSPLAIQFFHTCQSTLYKQVASVHN